MDFSTRRQLILKAAAQAKVARTKYKIRQGSAIDPISIAEACGCEVRFMALSSLEGLYSPTPKPVIILGSERPAGRRAYTCAHEIGHHEFNHGTRIDDCVNKNVSENNDPDEFLADMFAAFLLMPKTSLQKALKARNIEPQQIEPLQVFRMASYLNVGYGSLINHMTWTLGILNRQQCKSLLRTQPKEIKSMFGGSPQGEVIIVDELWHGRPVDLEIGDILVLPKDAILEQTQLLSSNGMFDSQNTYKAVARGYARAFTNDVDWGVNIRIASKHYQGLARFRFFEDPEEEDI
jgi:Zn-dependent peptidase ImmA (M78 family)